MACRPSDTHSLQDLRAGHAEAAIEYAFRAAAEGGEKVVAVHAWRVLDLSGLAAGTALLANPEVVMREEQVLLARSLARWAEQYPEVRVEHRVLRQHPVQALVEVAEGARLVAVGCRGRGTIRSALLGSVSHGVLHHASCPVAVVRPGS